MIKELMYVFGGSFDPFHLGHEAIVKSVAKEFGKILIIPTQNPWKPHGLLSLKDRIEVLKEFYKNDARVEISDLCLRDPEFNYMYKVVEFYSDKKIVFIMGEDTYENFPRWKNIEQFKEFVEVIVFKRDRNGMNLPDAPRIRMLPLKLYQNEISSSICRENIKKHKDLLPPKIYEIISTKLPT